MLPLATAQDERRIRQRIEALADCAIGRHDWQVTRTPGELVCSVCNALAYCPICLPHAPRTARLVRCPSHKETAR